MRGTLRMMAAAIALMLPMACAKTDDYFVPDEWETPGLPPAWTSDFEVALQTAVEMAPGPVPDAWVEGGTVHFSDVLYDPALAGEWTGGSCLPMTPEFLVALTYPSPPQPGAPRYPFQHIEQTALAHELGHYLWTRLGLRNADHPPEFQAWWAQVDAETARRLGR
ncbi:hypothetical protein [Anaeromyxobacter oryzae]|uniref:Metallopeptidase DUF4344 n=1 Tax=Anaeromyxobacter oryzae TaxID=2918170 RepID=A0ABM7WSQ4_9BACT|nr:hypothetical protein [Anaeromyxobacter oryzae]BDG02506.1 hypothetical protein AMOR_15020 [Anaeromyxobacter oryzae]